LPEAEVRKASNGLCDAVLIRTAKTVKLLAKVRSSEKAEAFSSKKYKHCHVNIAYHNLQVMCLWHFSHILCVFAGYVGVASGYYRSMQSVETRWQFGSLWVTGGLLVGARQVCACAYVRE